MSVPASTTPHPDILYQRQTSRPPRVSFILLDWKCRESFHMLDYMDRQDVERDDYEIVWVEYYDFISPKLQELLDQSSARGRPLIDKWIKLNMPDGLYYHKQRMYNAGFMMSSGDIVVVCDSDAMVKPGFVGTIIREFDSDPHQILHLDQIRNIKRDYYPFNYPTFEQMEGEGCKNFKNGKTLGMWSEEDVIHTRNYGACMCARKEDVISIGGSDEALDYLGHICGPYDLTFRLANKGLKEVWHQTEFMYHSWHPGTDGGENYLGPHDGKNVSTTALSFIGTGKTMPIKENAGIHMLRNALVAPSDHEKLMSLLANDGDIFEWSLENIKKSPLFKLSVPGSSKPGQPANGPAALFPTIKRIAKAVLPRHAYLDLKARHLDRKNEKDQEGPLLKIEKYMGFNVVLYKKQYHAIENGTGPFSLENARQGHYKHHIVTDTVSAALQAIRQMRRKSLGYYVKPVLHLSKSLLRGVLPSPAYQYCKKVIRTRRSRS